METQISSETFALPPDVLAVLQAEAATEHRCVDDVLRDAVQQYVWKAIWQESMAEAQANAKELGFDEEEVARLARKVSHLSVAGLEAMARGEIDLRHNHPDAQPGKNGI